MRLRPQLFGKTLFIDIMMSSVILLTGIMMVSSVEQERKEKAVQDANLKTDGIYAVVMEWPNDSEDDVDLYVRDPKGTVAFFRSRDVGLMHLEHDDRGLSSDRLMNDGSSVMVARNEERVIIRGAIPGEYIVNVHLFGKYGAGPVPVTVRLISLKGDDKEIVRKERTLTAQGDERTAFRFTLSAGDVASDINELERSFMGGGR